MTLTLTRGGGDYKTRQETTKRAKRQSQYRTLTTGSTKTRTKTRQNKTRQDKTKQRHDKTKATQDNSGPDTLGTCGVLAFLFLDLLDINMV